jgi:hypothetical protein
MPAAQLIEEMENFGSAAHENLTIPAAAAMKI